MENKEKMSLHRALAELKVIDSRIEKTIDLLEPTGIMQKDKLVNGRYKKEEFVANAISKYQSVTDLIARKNKIKAAIVAANSVTYVEINGVRMTISDAINFKSVISLKKNLWGALSKKHSVVNAKLNIENEKVNMTALENAKLVLGKSDEGKVKPTDADVKAIIEPFVTRNEYHIVDPIGVESVIDKLYNEITGIELEVDAALSEINAVTFIVI